MKIGEVVIDNNDLKLYSYQDKSVYGIIKNDDGLFSIDFFYRNVYQKQYHEDSMSAAKTKLTQLIINGVKTYIQQENESIMSFSNFKLFESPDTIFEIVDGKEIEYTAYNDDAIAFVVDPVEDKLYISERGHNHGISLTNITDDKKKLIVNSPTTDFTIPDIINGRLWYDREKKIISFWDYDPNYSIKKFLDDLTSQCYYRFGLDLDFSDNWYVEQRVDYNDGENHHKANYEIIPLEDFNGKIGDTSDDYAIHNLKAKDKKKILFDKGYRPKHKAKNMIDAEYIDKSTKYKFTEGVISFSKFNI